MWNWVQWSCLSFYSKIWNYWSAISNAVDVNKWVYYIEDENGILLARVLLAIDNDNKLMRFKMYFAKTVEANLNKYFNMYYIELAEKIWLKINWSQNKVENIESEKWYKDGTVSINI